MLFLDGSTFAVIISLLVVLVPHCWVRSRSSEYMLSFLGGREYFSHLLPCSYPIAVTGCSRGNLRRRILQMGSAVCRPCLHLGGAHRGHQDRVP